MPVPQEQRTVNGETREWNGSRWEPVRDLSQDNISRDAGVFGNLAKIPQAIGALPDIGRGLVSHPWETMKGFMGGAAEAATPAKLGTLAALGTGGASIPAQMAVSSGAEALAQALQLGTGSPDAPKSFGDAAGRTIGAGAITGAVGGTMKGLGAGYRAVKNAGPLVDSALELGSHVTGLKTLSKMGQAVRGITGGAEAATPATKYTQGIGRTDSISREVPGYTMPNDTAPLGGTPGPKSWPIEGGPLPREKPVFDVPESVKRATDSQPSRGAAAAHSATNGTITAAERTQLLNAGYSEDMIARMGKLPATPTPNMPARPGGIGARAPANGAAQAEQVAAGPLKAGGTQPPESIQQIAPPVQAPDVSAKYAFDSPSGAQFHISGGPSDRSTVGIKGLKELGIEVPEHTPSAYEPGASAAPPPSIQALTSEADIPTAPRLHAPQYDQPFNSEDMTDVWGPGSQRMDGTMSQARPMKGDADYVYEPASPNLKYDPQTPTSYLREQLANETDPAQQSFLQNAIDQRQRIERAATGLMNRAGIGK